MDINGLEGDINHFDELSAAIRQLFKLQMDAGHRYYRDGSTKDLREEGLALSLNELLFEVQGIVFQNSVFLLCQCIGTQGQLVSDLSKNISTGVVGNTKVDTNQLVTTIQRISETLKNFEIEKIRVKKEHGGMTGDISARTLHEFVVEDDDIIYILNSIPPKYLIQWLAHSVNVNILPFKHEMYKLIGRA